MSELQGVSSYGANLAGPNPVDPAEGGYVVIVDAYSSGKLFAPAIRDKGYDVIHVRSSMEVPKGYDFIRGDFDKEFIYNGENLNTIIESLKVFNVMAVIAGAEPGVMLADILSAGLGVFTNGTELSLARKDKYLMGKRLVECGVKAAKQFQAKSVEGALKWIKGNVEWPVVLKPLMSVGTDSVYFCYSEGEVINAFDKIFGKTNDMLLFNDSVLVQEFLDGIEYDVNTVSSNGVHLITDIWQYFRRAITGAATVYELDRLLPFKGEIQSQLINYSFKVLDALGIKFGPAHLEIKATKNGPRLVEANIRMCGAGLPWIVELAAGQSQVDRTIAAYLNPAEFAGFQQGYAIQKNASVVFLQSKGIGVMSYGKLGELRNMPAVVRYNMYFKEGEALPFTHDSDSHPGAIFLLHEDPNVIRKTEEEIRWWNEMGFFEKLLGGSIEESEKFNPAVHGIVSEPSEYIRDTMESVEKVERKVERNMRKGEKK